MPAKLFTKTSIAAAILSLCVGAGPTPVAQAAGTYDKQASPPAATPAASAKQAGARASSAALSSGDRKFIEEAARGGVAEVELGKLAAQKASSPEVKQFGQRMVDDHSKANDKLQQLASQKGVNVPNEMDAVSKREYDKLQKLSGASFDQEYIKAMVKDHHKDVKDFQKEEKSAKDAELKTFVSTTLPTLEQHLKLAESDQTAVKNQGKSASATWPQRQASTGNQKTGM